MSVKILKLINISPEKQIVGTSCKARVVKAHLSRVTNFAWSLSKKLPYDSGSGTRKEKRDKRKRKEIEGKKGKKKKGEVKEKWPGNL